MRLLSLIGAALFFVWTTAYGQQTYPNKDRPIRILVPFGVGSGNDLIARAYARAISEDAGQSVVVENKPGAEAVIGVEAVRNAAPDGYTVLFGNSSTHVLNALMLQKIPYDPIADFIPVSGVSSVALVLNTGPSTSFKTITDVVEAARANPGKFTYGSATTSTRLAMEMFVDQANVELLSVPYKAMAQATTALSAGEIDLLVNDVVTSVPHYKSGRVRPLGSTGAKRLTALPEVPTIKEQGLTGYEFTAWSAMFLPKGTPADVVGKLQTILQQAQRSKYVTDILAINSQDPLLIQDGEITELIRTDTEKWRKVATSLKAPK